MVYKKLFLFIYLLLFSVKCNFPQKKYKLSCFIFIKKLFYPNIFFMLYNQHMFNI